MGLILFHATTAALGEVLGIFLHLCFRFSNSRDHHAPPPALGAPNKWKKKKKKSRPLVHYLLRLLTSQMLYTMVFTIITSWTITMALSSLSKGNAFCIIIIIFFFFSSISYHFTPHIGLLWNLWLLFSQFL